jgi:hypothetical protein
VLKSLTTCLAFSIPASVAGTDFVSNISKVFG